MNHVIERFKDLFASVADQAYSGALSILPKAALSVVVIGLGILIAAGLHHLAMYCMRVFAVDKLAGKTPLSRMLKHIGVQKTVSEIVSLLVFWFAVLFTLVFAADILDLHQLSRVLDMITRFIPRVIAALLIVFGGMLLARFITVLIEQPLKRSGITFAAAVSKAVYSITVVFVMLFAVDQLGLDLSFITVNVMIMLAAVIIIIGVGCAVACRAFLENMLACHQLKFMINIGDSITVLDRSGTVIGFTSVAVLIDDNRQTAVIPAGQFLQNSYSIRRA